MSCKGRKRRKGKKSCGGSGCNCGCGCGCKCEGDRGCCCCRPGSGCGCGGGGKKKQCKGPGHGDDKRGFQRHIYSKAEKAAARVARLEKYLAELEAEAVAVKERIAALKGGDDPGSCCDAS